jgi:glucarate dehydratase
LRREVDSRRGDRRPAMSASPVGVLRHEVAVAVEIGADDTIPTITALRQVVLASAETGLPTLGQVLERTAGQLASGVELAVRLDGRFEPVELGQLCELGQRLGLAAIADPCADLADACDGFARARVPLAISAHRHPPAELARAMAVGGFQVLLIDPTRLQGGTEAVRGLATCAELCGVEVGLVAVGQDDSCVTYAAGLAASLEACTWPLMVSIETASRCAGSGRLLIGATGRSDAAPAISRITFRRVSVPMRQLYVSAMYMRRTTERLFIEIETNDGLRGFGETNGTAEVTATCAEMARKLLGRHPLDHPALRRACVGPMTASRNGLRDWSAWAGLEMALFDWQGRHQNQPIFRMLGGRGETSIEAVCHIPALVLDDPVDRRDLPKLFADPARRRQVVEHTLHQQRHAGFTAFKIKSTGTCPDWDTALLRDLRAALGDRAKLRWDPNANYPPAQALALAQRLEELNLEYYEDPTRGIAGMAQLRAHVATKLATNMCVITFDHLAHALHQPCVDVVLADVVMWGGPQSIVDLAAAVDFGLENMEAELIVPRIPVERGRVHVPEGPGLGVEPDWDEVARYATEVPITFGT